MRLKPDRPPARAGAPVGGVEMAEHHAGHQSLAGKVDDAIVRAHFGRAIADAFDAFAGDDDVGRAGRVVAIEQVGVVKDDPAHVSYRDRAWPRSA